MDWECFCIGDEDEMQDIMQKLHMEETNTLLQRFFEEFR